MASPLSMRYLIKPSAAPRCPSSPPTGVPRHDSGKPAGEGLRFLAGERPGQFDESRVVGARQASPALSPRSSSATAGR